MSPVKPPYLEEYIAKLQTVAEGIEKGEYNFVRQMPDSIGRFGEDEDMPTPTCDTGIYKKGSYGNTPLILTIPGVHEAAVEVAIQLRLILRERLDEEHVEIEGDTSTSIAIKKILKRSTLEVPATKEFSQLESEYNGLKEKIQGLDSIVKTIMVWSSPMEISYGQSLNFSDATIMGFRSTLENIAILLELFEKNKSEKEGAEILFETERLLNELSGILDRAEKENSERLAETKELEVELEGLRILFEPVLAKKKFFTEKQRDFLDTKFDRAKRYLQGTSTSMGGEGDSRKGVPEVKKAEAEIEEIKKAVPSLNESTETPWYLANAYASDIIKEYGTVIEGRGVTLNSDSEIFPLVPGKNPVVSMEIREFNDTDEVTLTSSNELRPIGGRQLLERTRNGKVFLAVAEGQNWSIAWRYSRGGSVIEYCFANASGIGNLDNHGRFTSKSWGEQGEAGGVTEEELKGIHGLQKQKGDKTSDKKNLPEKGSGTFADLFKKK